MPLDVIAEQFTQPNVLLDSVHFPVTLTVGHPLRYSIAVNVEHPITVEDPLQFPVTVTV